MTPEIATSTAALVLLRWGILPRIERPTDDSRQIKVTLLRPLKRPVHGEIRRLILGELTVGEDLAVSIAGEGPDVDFLRARMAQAFNPKDIAAANVQLARLKLLGYRVTEHPQWGDRFAVWRERIDMLPTWTVGRAPFTSILYDQHSPMEVRAFERLVKAIADEPPHLECYAPAQVRWRYAQAVAHELRRFGWLMRFKPNPGRSGDIERVPIHDSWPVGAPSAGRVADYLPAWRIHHAILLPELEAIEPPVGEDDIEKLLNRLQGPGELDLSDWRA